MQTDQAGSTSTIERPVFVDRAEQEIASGTVSHEGYDYEFESHRTPNFLRFSRETLSSVCSYQWAIRSFVANSLDRRYRRSILGFFWGLLGPLLTLTVMSIAYSLVFHTDPARSISYIFSGLVAWSFMSESALQGSQCLVGAETYLKKISVPKIFFPLVSVGTDTVNCVYSMVSLLTLAAIFGVHLKLSIMALPLIIAIVAAYNLGMVMLYSVATVYFRDLPHILAVTYPAFFYAVPVFYPMSAIPTQYHWVFWLNPFYWFINLFRRVIHDGVFPTLNEWCIPVALASTALLAGLFVLSLKDRTLIYRL